MTPAPLVLAAVLAMWGPVWPAPAAPESGVAEPAAATPPEAAPALQAPTDVTPAAVPAAAAAAPPAILAKGPIDLRAGPALVAPARRPHEPPKPLHKQWPFWAIAGGFFVAVVTAVVIATRPSPEAYRGNTPPYYMPFP